MQPAPEHSDGTADIWADRAQNKPEPAADFVNRVCYLESMPIPADTGYNG